MLKPLLSHNNNNNLWPCFHCNVSLLRSFPLQTSFLEKSSIFLDFISSFFTHTHHVTEFILQMLPGSFQLPYLRARSVLFYYTSLQHLTRSLVSSTSPNIHRFPRIKFSKVPCLVMSPCICTGRLKSPSSHPVGTSVAHIPPEFLESSIQWARSPLNYICEFFVITTSLQSNRQVLEAFSFSFFF